MCFVAYWKGSVRRGVLIGRVGGCVRECEGMRGRIGCDFCAAMMSLFGLPYVRNFVWDMGVDVFDGTRKVLRCLKVSGQ